VADKLWYMDRMNRYSPIVSEFGSAEEEAAYDVWYRKQVQEALDDPRPCVPHDEAMARIRATVEKAKAKATKC
jgi:hypothetical protein